MTNSSKQSWIKASSEAILALSRAGLKLHAKLKISPLRSYRETSSEAILALSGAKLKLHAKLKINPLWSYGEASCEANTVSSFNQELASYAKLAHLG